jgi:hypothetical protein
MQTATTTPRLLSPSIASAGSKAWSALKAPSSSGTQAQRLIAMRDPMGGYPIFHSAHPHTAQRGAVAVGTSMEALLDRLGSRTLNREYLADYLMSPIISVEESADRRAAYDRVRRPARHPSRTHSESSGQRTFQRGFLLGVVAQRAEPGSPGRTGSSQCHGVSRQVCPAGLPATRCARKCPRCASSDPAEFDALAPAVAQAPAAAGEKPTTLSQPGAAGGCRRHLRRGLTTSVWWRQSVLTNMRSRDDLTVDDARTG